MLIRDEGEESVRPFSFFNGLLLHRRLSAALGRQEPHLDEPHGLVRQIVDLRVPHPRAHGRVLDPAFPENAARAPLVCVPELARCAVSHHLVVPVWMEGPDGAGGQRVVVENAERAEVDVLRVMIVAEGEVPSAVERAGLNVALDSIYFFRFPYGNHVAASAKSKTR